jgi:hypothetical protein
MANSRGITENGVAVDICGNFFTVGDFRKGMDGHRYAQHAERKGTVMITNPKYIRIEITWPSPIDPSKDQALIGFCTIYEGNNLNEMKPRDPERFKVEVTKNSVRMHGETYVNLPIMSEEERNKINMMARHYWAGYFRQLYITEWVKVGE